MDGLKHHVISHYVEESISELRRKQTFPQSIEICVTMIVQDIFYEKNRWRESLILLPIRKSVVSEEFQMIGKYLKNTKLLMKQSQRNECWTWSNYGHTQTETNLQLTNQLVSAHDVQSTFGKMLAKGEPVETIDLKKHVPRSRRNWKYVNAQMEHTTLIVLVEKPT